MRRRFWLILMVALLASFPLLTGAASSRSYVSNNYMLTLDGVNTGFLKSVQGGNIYSVVISEPVGPDGIIHKHLAQPRYQDVTMQVGFGMTKSVYDWIGGSWKGSFARKNGEIVAMDYNYQATASRQFYNALLTETTIPALDGAGKEPAYITLKFAPEYTRASKPKTDTKSAAATAPTKPEAQKTFIPSNFRVEIDGLDTSKVGKIDAFTVKQKVMVDQIADSRDQVQEPTRMEFPNLKLTIAAAGIDDWNAWLDDFVVRGNNGQDQEKNGTIYLLATNRQDVLAKVKLFNIGIVSIDAVNSEDGSDAVQRYVVELYVERMEFEGPQPTK